ncbi:MAG: LPO_1073/Vpar_1526 family protein [bacterium]
MSHPSTSLLIQKAMVSAAVTDNDDRHEILSELIAQRLTAGADDMIALVGSAACDVVNSLASRQIRLLGLLALLWEIKPTEEPEIVDQGEYDAYVSQYWMSRSQFLEDLHDVGKFDVWHLTALSCMFYTSGYHDILDMLSLPVKPKQMKPTESHIKKALWWNDFEKVWNIGLAYSSPTTTGILIGTLYHDGLYQTRTELNW